MGRRGIHLDAIALDAYPTRTSHAKGQAMSTMRQRKHRFNKANRVISLKLPMHLVEFLNQIPDSEIRRAMNLFLKGKP